MTVIYADVLFIINFFITFLLLQLTEKLCKRSERLWRMVLASFAGGAYSLVILIDELAPALSYLGRLAAAFVIILIAFSWQGVKCLIKETAVFFLANFILLGLIVGLWLLLKPAGVVINNSVVYFRVSAKTLLVSALVAYVISVIALRIYNSKIAKNRLYEVTVFLDENRTRFFALADSGNNLREPFSDYPVIVAEKSLFPDAKCSRVVPFTSIGGEGILHAFKPDKVIVSTAEKEAEIRNIYIALSDNVKRGEYRGILNPQNIYSEVHYAEKN